jgi:hypothetical protein
MYSPIFRGRTTATIPANERVNPVTSALRTLAVDTAQSTTGVISQNVVAVVLLLLEVRASQANGGLRGSKLIQGCAVLYIRSAAIVKAIVRMYRATAACRVGNVISPRGIETVPP